MATLRTLVRGEAAIAESTDGDTVVMDPSSRAVCDAPIGVSDCEER
ncbi:hypothetical protein GCM10027068_19570 [Prescottella soli]